MNRLDKLRQLSTNTTHASQAMQAVSDDSLSFGEKLTKVQQLEQQAGADERELFGDVYASLQLRAKTENDFELLSKA